MSAFQLMTYQRKLYSKVGPTLSFGIGARGGKLRGSAFSRLEGHNSPFRGAAPKPASFTNSVYPKPTSFFAPTGDSGSFYWSEREFWLGLNGLIQSTPEITRGCERL